MTTTYFYNIAINIPGGVVTSDTQVRLNSLCGSNIATPLENIRVNDGDLALTFSEALSPAEKLILDGGTVPAGGLLEEFADYIEILVEDLPIPNYGVVRYLPDGFSHLDVLLQRRQGNGEIRTGTSEPIDILIFGLLFINKTTGNFDPANGQFSFRLMPSKDRTNGFFSIMIFSDALPIRVFSVHLASELP